MQLQSFRISKVASVGNAGWNYCADTAFAQTINEWIQTPKTAKRTQISWKNLQDGCVKSKKRAHGKRCVSPTPQDCAIKTKTPIPSPHYAHFSVPAASLTRTGSIEEAEQWQFLWLKCWPRMISSTKVVHFKLHRLLFKNKQNIPSIQDISTNVAYCTHFQFSYMHFGQCLPVFGCLECLHFYMLYIKIAHSSVLLLVFVNL